MDKDAHREFVIGLIGQGTMHQQVKRHLEGIYRVVSLTEECIPQQYATCQIIIYCRDTWIPKTLQEINRCCLQSGVALLPVYTRFDEGIVGPCVIPDKKGCTSCAELRTLGAISSEPERALAYQYQRGERALLVSQSWLSSFSIEMLTLLLLEEIAAYLYQPDRLQTSCALLTLSLETLDCHRHPFLSLASCPDCGTLSDDSAEMARLLLHSCPKVDALTYRARQPESAVQQVFAEYVDERMGLVHAFNIEHRGLLPVVTSLLDFELADDQETVGTGCTFFAEQSKLVSVLECVERYAGLRPRMKRAKIWSSYHDLAQRALPVLDPMTLGLHSPEQYTFLEEHHTCAHLVRYHPDLTYNWVWGYSFQRQSPILVPEHLAYYDIPSTQENPAFVYETSNGCALGRNLEEAIFHGMIEVIERDAFLLTWYARLYLPHLSPFLLTDPIIRVLVERIQHHSGYTIVVLNATLDHMIPCLCVLAVDERNHAGMPKAHIAAGAHPHPEQALLRALRELSTFLDRPPSFYQRQRAEALEMLTNPYLVQNMDDHPLIYYQPEAFARLDFLYHARQPQTFQQAFRTFYDHPYDHPLEHMDLKDDLESLVNYYLRHDIDTIFVDQTAPEHIPCGLRCVKVLMPGMLPMTFGHEHSRTRGFKRLQHLPFMLGYRPQPLTEDEISSYPHPFY